MGLGVQKLAEKRPEQDTNLVNGFMFEMTEVFGRGEFTIHINRYVTHYRCF